MRRLPPWLAVALGAALLAGCGGKKTYTLAKTRACLAEQPGLRLTSRVDFVASTAPAGAIRARLPDNLVTISFGDDEEGASRIADGYRRVRGRNIGIEDVLRPQRNAVLLWVAHPSPADEQTVTGCLK